MSELRAVLFLDTRVTFLVHVYAKPMTSSVGPVMLKGVLSEKPFWKSSAQFYILNIKEANHLDFDMIISGDFPI